MQWKKLRLDNQKLSAGSHRAHTPGDSRSCRYRTPWIAALAPLAIAFACGAPTAIDRASDGGEPVAIDAGAHEQDPTWCSVQAILTLKCQRCHGPPAQHGAPFALASYEDTQAHDYKGKLRFERIAEVVDERSMPAQYVKLEPPVEPLTDDERETILTWCAQGGLLTGSADCEPSAP